MPFVNAAKQTMLEAISARVDLLSLHTDTPDGTGSNEVSGGDYAKEAVTWGSFSAGSIPIGSSVEFDVPADTTIDAVGLWDDTVWLGYVLLDEPEAFAAAGTFTLNTSTVLTLSDPA